MVRFPLTSGRLLLSRLCVAICVTLLASTTFVTVARATPIPTSNVPPASAFAVSIDTAESVNADANDAVTCGGCIPSCPASYSCAWINAGYGGARGQWAGNNANWRVFPRSGCQTGTWNDCASSFRNHGTYCTVSTYRDAYGGGGGIIWFLGDSSSNLNDQSINDEISSDVWCQ